MTHIHRSFYAVTASAVVEEKIDEEDRYESSPIGGQLASIGRHRTVRASRPQSLFSPQLHAATTDTIIHDSFQLWQ